MAQVSVVVPCYNAAPYLQTCVDSLVRQSIQDIEILLTDDGSSDETRALAQRLAQDDGRITVLTQPHTGPGAARNRGLDMARAPYVMFVDADDEAAPAACERLLRRAQETHADIVIGPSRGRLESAAARVQALYTGRISMGVYGKLFKRAFLDAHAIRFPPAIYIEDRHFLLRCLVAGPSLASFDEVLYHRHLRPESSMHRVGAKHIADATAVYELDVGLLERAGLLPACGFHAARATLVVDRYLARRIPAGNGAADLRGALRSALQGQERLFRRLPMSVARRFLIWLMLSRVRATL
jgi:glycosyltransferase involved in cell wall biosynthesis